MVVACAFWRVGGRACETRWFKRRVREEETATTSQTQGPIHSCVRNNLAAGLFLLHTHTRSDLPDGVPRKGDTQEFFDHGSGLTLGAIRSYAEGWRMRHELCKLPKREGERESVSVRVHVRNIALPVWILDEDDSGFRVDEMILRIERVATRRK